jgi:UDPglucose--hexose-1-phosphate uridylyltransferase
MSELRHNSITRQWVIVAENRGARPQDLVVQQVIQDTAHCPFCEAHEESTPGEVLALRSSESRPNEPGWRVRVVPNKFPAVDAAPQSTTGGEHDGHRILPGVGVHEIIIESPQHLTSVTQLTDEQFTDVIDVYRQRLAELRCCGQFSDAVLFKNSGAGGGATLAHLHSQLVALNSNQSIFTDRTPAFREYAEEFGTCPLCTAANKSADDARLVAQSEHFLALCPFASRFAYEMWLVPREHRPQFEEMDATMFPELAQLLRAVLVKLEATVKSSAYNYIIHTAPFDTSGTNHYHWHIEILPRLSSLAGFELGTGCFINTVSPEHAAELLRDKV